MTGVAEQTHRLRELLLLAVVMVEVVIRVWLRDMPAAAAGAVETEAPTAVERVARGSLEAMHHLPAAGTGVAAAAQEVRAFLVLTAVPSGLETVEPVSFLRLPGWRYGAAAAVAVVGALVAAALRHLGVEGTAKRSALPKMACPTPAAEEAGQMDLLAMAAPAS